MRLSVRTFLQAERQRVQDWVGGSADSLESVETARTVGDCVDRERLGRRLPDGWCVDREIVQFPGESLSEVVRLTDREAYRITLKPVELCAPTEQVEIYTRSGPDNTRRQRRTADSLAEALIYATGMAARRHARRTQSASGSTETASSSH